MKKLFVVLMLILALVVCFAACTKDETPEEEKPEQEIPSEKEETLEEYVERVGEPYTISYVSNGDGTCYVDEIIVNRDFKRNFKLEIPEKSPYGDTVVSIESYGFLKCDNVPRMMTKEDADKLFVRLEEAMETPESNDWEFYYCKFCVYYQPISLYQMKWDTGELLLDENGEKIPRSTQECELLLSDFPILKEVDCVFVLVDFEEMRCDEMQYLSETLTKYLNYTEQDRFEVDLQTNSKYSAYENKTFQLDYIGSSYIESVSLPESVVKLSKCMQRLPNNAYNKFDNGYYLGTATNPYKILIQATDEDITSCNVNNSTEIISHLAFEGCEALQKIIIPQSVSIICGCIADMVDNDLKIYCEAEEKPDGWEFYWNHADNGFDIEYTIPVVWGYTGEK